MLEVSGSVVRLDNAAFYALVKDPEAPEHRDVVTIPGMVEAIGAVRDPLGRIDILIAGAGDVTRHHVWLGDGVALFLLTVREPARQLLVVPPAHVPSGLARVLRLGPRPTATRRLESIDPVDLEAVFDVEAVDADQRQRLLAQWDATAAWSLVLEYGDQERRALFLDGPEGLRLVLPDPEPPTAEEAWQALPISATTAWTHLCSLLPTDEDLASAQTATP